MDRDTIKGLLDRFPQKVPVAMKDPKGILKSTKYLVPRDETVAEFIAHLRQRSTLDPSQALFLFIGNTIPMATKTIGELYDKYKGEDYMLTLGVMKESSFGSPPG